MTEWPERLTLRDTKIYADEGQRIYTTATGYGYEKCEYVRADAALSALPAVQALADARDAAFADSAHIRSALSALPAAQVTDTPKRKPWPEPGDKLVFLNRHGYDHERLEAAGFMKEGDVLTLKRIRVGDWSHSLEFEELPGKRFNGVMFDYESALAPAMPEVTALRHRCAASGRHEHDGCTCSDDELLRGAPAMPDPTPHVNKDNT